MNSKICRGSWGQTLLLTRMLWYGARKPLRLCLSLKVVIQWHWNIYHTTQNSASLRTFDLHGKRAVRMWSAYSLTAKYAVNALFDYICATITVFLWQPPQAIMIPLIWCNDVYTNCNICSGLLLIWSVFYKELALCWWDEKKGCIHGHLGQVVYITVWKSTAWNYTYSKLERQHRWNVLDKNQIHIISYYWRRQMRTPDCQTIERQKPISNDSRVDRDYYPVSCNKNEQR